MLLYGSDYVHLTVQLARSEEIRLPFDFKNLRWEYRGAAGRLRYRLFQIEDM